MSLFQAIMKAEGGSSANYLQKGVHLVRIVRASTREADALKAIKAGFMADVELINSNCFGTATKGDVLRITEGFKYPSGLARVRRFAAVSKTAATGTHVPEDTLGVDPSQTLEELERLFGPTNPLAGAFLKLNVTGHVNKTTGNAYTLWEPMLPNEEDLRAAGLIK
jgi:hypothetical protein